MPYPTPLIKFSFGGSLADGLEIWSCGLTMDFVGGEGYEMDLFTDWQEDFDLFVTAVENFISEPDARVPTGVQLTWVKAALVGTDGAYLMEPVEAPASASGGDAGGYLPQGALVYTLVSSRWKDPGRYNRFYLPTSTPTSTTGWRLTEAQADDAAGACHAFLDALDGLGSVASLVVVASPVGAGHNNSVEEIRVGRLIDTQRRRRNAIAEDYSVVPRFPFPAV